MRSFSVPRWVRYAVWIIFTVLWTKALLSPIPIDPDVTREHETLLFYVHKTTHVLAYALYACLTVWLDAAPRVRLVLFLFLVAHAFLVEYGQNWVPGRYATFHDVGLNLLGIGLGTWLTKR